jgi:hypothetical protein
MSRKRRLRRLEKQLSRLVKRLSRLERGRRKTTHRVVDVSPKHTGSATGTSTVKTPTRKRPTRRREATGGKATRKTAPTSRKAISKRTRHAGGGALSGLPS